MVKRVLMIAFHYPPVKGSSGIQRTLKFARYLPEFDWRPIVLAPHPRAYEAVTDAQMGDIGPDTIVSRSFALDTARHLAIGGRYAAFMALPDPWVSWWLGAVPTGLRLIRKYRPAAIWSTYPIATAHLIGLTLNRLTGIPWVADFRDPMVEANYPRDPLKKKAYAWIERHAVRACAAAVVTTPGAMRLYRQRFPETPGAHFTMIQNGFDEDDFAGIEQTRGALKPESRPLILLHSGTLYPSERDPRALFAALARLRAAGLVAAGNFRLVLRATGHDNYLRSLIVECGIEDIVALEPALPYRNALEEMMGADGLLILQASNCNDQIPAKLYEYYRARRPILALTDPRGDTAAMLRDAGIDTIAPLDSQQEITELLARFLELLKQQRAPIAADSIVAAASRRGRTGELARVLNEVSGR